MRGAPMTEVTFAGRLRTLALALLNATLMLAVVLVFGLWLLIGRVQGFAADTAAAAANAIGTDLRERAGAQVTAASGAIERLRGIEARLDTVAARAQGADSAAAAEIAGLRGDVQALTASLDRIGTGLSDLRADGSGSLRAALRQIFIDMADRIGPLPAEQ